MNTQEMPRSNLAKTITLRVSLVPRLQVWHKDEIKKDPRVTSEDFGGFLMTSLNNYWKRKNMQNQIFRIALFFQYQIM